MNSPHPLTNFEIQKYYQNDTQLNSKNESKFNGVYSRNNWRKVKYEAYVINLDEYESIGTPWVAFYVNAENGTYFDNFGGEHIPKEIKKFIGNKNIVTNIYRTQAYHSIMCGYFCIEFIDLKIILRYFW